jgi:hypothetical protein
MKIKVDFYFEIYYFITIIYFFLAKLDIKKQKYIKPYELKKFKKQTIVEVII